MICLYSIQIHLNYACRKQIHPICASSWLIFIFWKAAFVVCRVFVKSRSGNSISEIGISSAMEESVSAVRHIGVQHDGSLTSSFLEAELHDDKIIDGRLVSQLDNRVMQGPIPVARFQLPMDTPSSEQVTNFRSIPL